MLNPKDGYKDSDPYDYFMAMRSHYLIHPKTEEALEKMLRILKEEGEEAGFQYVKEVVLGKK